MTAYDVAEGTDFATRLATTISGGSANSSTSIAT
jgi:hypothetical protein